MLVYGAAAQDYMDYNTDNLADSSNWVNDYKSSFTVPTGVKNITGNTDKNNKIKAASLHFSNVNKIYFRLILTDENVKVLLNGLEINRASLEKQKDGTYLLYTKDLKATEFDKVFTLTLVDASGKELSKAEYNVNAYIQAKYESQSVGTIVKALNNYGVSAKNDQRSFATNDGNFNLDDEDNLF
jgi:hypothetical protein